METISVIIVNYNGKIYNQKCIESIKKSTIWERIRIIVVDNGSIDGSIDELEYQFKDENQIFFIRLGDNYGFSKANNEGIKMAMKQECFYFLLLNNDTVIENDTIENLVNCAQQKQRIIVPKIYYYEQKGKIWFAGGKFSRIIKKAIHIGLNKLDNGKFNKASKCEFANGCCLLLNKDIIKKIGFLDERFFLYYEDTEYSFRAKKNGIEIWYCPKAKVYHKVNGATGGNDNANCAYYIARNWLLCNCLYLGKQWFLFIIYYFINRLAWIFIWLLHGRMDLIQATHQGIMDFKRKKWGKRKNNES